METYVRINNENRPILKITEKGCFKEFNGELFAFIDASTSYRYENGERVIKKSENIEELCDEFILFDDENKIHYKSKEGAIWFVGAGLYSESVRGAIFTNKGIIYVVKLNKKGEWELIH